MKLSAWPMYSMPLSPKTPTSVPDTVSDTVSDTSVAGGNLYNYFDSRWSIFVDILDELMDAINTAVAPNDVEQLIPLQVLDNLDKIIAICACPEVARIFFTEATEIDDEGTMALRGLYRWCAQRIVCALYIGQTMGIVRRGIMPLTAQMLLGIVPQPVMMAALEGRPLDAGALASDSFALIAAGLLR